MSGLDTLARPGNVRDARIIQPTASLSRNHGTAGVHNGLACRGEAARDFEGGWQLLSTTEHVELECRDPEGPLDQLERS